MDFGGFDSSIILILMGGIPRPIGDFPGSLNQAMLVGVMLVGRFGVRETRSSTSPSPRGGSEEGDQARRSLVSDLHVIFKCLFGREFRFNVLSKHSRTTVASSRRVETDVRQHLRQDAPLRAASRHFAPLRAASRRFALLSFAFTVYV